MCNLFHACIATLEARSVHLESMEELQLFSLFSICLCLTLWFLYHKYTISIQRYMVSGVEEEDS